MIPCLINFTLCNYAFAINHTRTQVKSKNISNQKLLEGKNWNNSKINKKAK